MPAVTPQDLEKLKQSLSADKRMDELQNDPERLEAQRTFDVGNAMTSGKMPTTKQTVAGIDKVLDDRTLSKGSRDLGPEGRKVLADAEQVLEAMKETLLDKNANDELQNAIFYARNAVTKLSADDMALDKDTQTLVLQAKEQARVGMDQLIELSKLIVTSSEFRDLLADLSTLVRTVLRGDLEENGGETTQELLKSLDAEKAANSKGSSTLENKLGERLPTRNDSLENSPQQLSTFSSDNASTQSLKSLPLNSSTASSTGSGTFESQIYTSSANQPLLQSASQTRGIPVEQTEGLYPEKSIEHERFDSKQASTDAFDASKAYPIAQSEPFMSSSNNTQQQWTNESTSNWNRDSLKEPTTGSVGVNRPTDPLSWTNEEKTTGVPQKPITDESRHAAHHVANKVTKTGLDIADKVKTGETTVGGAASEASKMAINELRGTFGNLSLDENLRGEILEKFRLFVSRMQSRREYVDSVQYLIGIVSNAVEKSSVVMDQLQTKSETVHSRVSRELQLARNNFQKLIENFAQHKSLDPLIRSIADLHTAVANDSEGAAFFKQVRDFFERSLLDADALASDKVADEFQAIVDRGNRLATGRYQKQIDKVNIASADFVDAMREDDVSNNLTRRVDRLVSDLTLDERGEYAVKTDMIRDLAKILPAVVGKLGHLPVPRLEFEDEDYHVILDNVVVQCRDLLPDYIEIATDTVIKEKMRQAIGFKISHIRLSARDIAFYYKKKSGMVQTSDVGLLDFDIKGKEGVTIKVLIEPELSPEPGNNIIARRKVVVNIDDISLKLHETRRDFLYKLFTPLFKSKVKKQIANGMEEAINGMIDSFNAKVAEQTARKAQLRAKEDPRDKLSSQLPQWGSKAFEVEP